MQTSDHDTHHDPAVRLLIAAAEKRGAARALRELADDIDSTGYGWASVIDAERFKQRVRARADRIGGER